MKMDEGSQPRVGNNRSNGKSNNYGGHQGQGNYSVQNEIGGIRQELCEMRSAVAVLEQEKDSLRKAIRKLKLENEHMKKKYKTIQEKIGGNNDDDSCPEIELDYDEIGRDFLLIGGVHDPFSLRYEAKFTDAAGIEHKSAERYYWYKMAEFFKDANAMKLILEAIDFQSAEDAMKDIKDFKETLWDEQKLKFWEEAQRLKLVQNRSLLNLLVLSDKTYIAFASQDKFYGTGWRKSREESNKPVYWDGENMAGKTLMRLRKELKQNHSFKDESEKESTRIKLNDLRRFTWRRIDPSKVNGFRGRGRYRGNFSRRP